MADSEPDMALSSAPLIEPLTVTGAWFTGGVVVVAGGVVVDVTGGGVVVVGGVLTWPFS